MFDPHEAWPKDTMTQIDRICLTQYNKEEDS